MLLTGAALIGFSAAARPSNAWRGLGWLLVVAGLFYPLVGLAAGRPWVQAEFFGMAPEPTALLTLGLLLVSGQPASRLGRALLFPIPLLCLLLGAATGWTFLN